MSQQKEDALINESIDSKEKDNNQDQDVGKFCKYVWIIYLLESYGL